MITPSLLQNLKKRWKFLDDLRDFVMKFLSVDDNPFSSKFEEMKMEISWEQFVKRFFCVECVEFLSF